MTLDEFNGLATADAVSTLLSCCRCKNWASDVVNERPFASIEQLTERASVRWQAATEEERLEAFAAHPLIGDVDLLRQRFADTARSEQGQVLAAQETTIQALAELNVAYQQRHGFIFIICATGKSAEEMLAQLRKRLDNDRATESDNAAAEQGKILLLRLQQLWESP